MTATTTQGVTFPYSLPVDPPRRFNKDPQWAAQAVRGVKFFTRGPVAPTEAELRRHVEAVYGYDKAGALLARAILSDKTVSMAQFRKATSEGVASVPRAHPDLLAFFNEIESQPRWLDHERIARGGRVCMRSGKTGAQILATGSLMGGYVSAASSRQLVATRRLVSDVDRRVAETTRWWFECISPSGMERGSQGWQLTCHVRLMHAIANYKLLHNSDWDLSDWGMPINQADQAATLGLFSTTFLLGLRSLGVSVSVDEGRDVMHLWRYIGWLLGVDEQWLVDDEMSGRRLMCQFGLLAPAADENSRILATSLYNSWRKGNFRRFMVANRIFQQKSLLSLQRLFSGKSGLKDLGLPASTIWYVPIAWITNFPFHTLASRSRTVERILVNRGENYIKSWLALNEPPKS
ncbi:MAG: oxygenase MpaB family protein [Mycobacteriaceae bacterium]